MKKLILMSMVLCGAMVASADSYLYWMVDQTNTETQPWAFTDAALTATAGGVKSVVDAWGVNVPEGEQPQPVTSMGTAVWSSLAGFTDGAYTFAIELFNSDYTAPTHSLSIGTYQDLAQFIHSSVGDLTKTPLVATSFAVPEPTSGLMMLVGMALLGLRRKKA